MKKVICAVVLLAAHWSYANNKVEKMYTLTCVNNTGFDVQLEVCAAWNSRLCGTSRLKRSGLVHAEKGNTVKFAMEESMNYFVMYANNHTVGGKKKKARMQFTDNHTITIDPFDKDKGHFGCSYE